MEGPTVTPEVEQLLIRYLQIQDEVRRLEEEKAALNGRLCQHLAEFAQPCWFPTVAGQAIKVRVRHEVQVLYDEGLLRQRLGERYVQILKADPAKVRRHLTDIEDLLRPALDRVGSPDRERVRTAVESGVVPRDAFNGAYEKTSWTTVAVMRLREKDRDSRQRNDGPCPPTAAAASPSARPPAARPGRPAGRPGWQGTASVRLRPRPPAVTRGSAPGAAA